MNVYRLEMDMGTDGNCIYCRLLIVDDGERRLLDESFRGKAIPQDRWIPFKVVRSPSTPGNLTKPLGDRAGIDFNTDPMVLSRRALEVLVPSIGAFGQVLPLDFEEADYSLFNITNVIDALDVPRSDVAYFADGGFKRVKRYAFKPEAIRDQWIFKIPQQPGCFAFVTDRFVNLVKSAGLSGFGFDLLWSEEKQSQTAAASTAG